MAHFADIAHWRFKHHLPWPAAGHCERGVVRWLPIFLVACLLFNGLQGWQRHIGLGRLPGDFRFRFRGREWFVPLTSSLVLRCLAMLIGMVV